MRHARLLPILLVTSLALAACSGSGGGSPSPEPPAPAGAAAVNGRTFIATQLEGRVLVGGSEIRLTFQDGQLSGSAGCNAMGGEYRIEDGRLITGMLVMTEMACEEPLMAQEAWFAQLLQDGPAIALDGNTLVLTGEGVVLTMVDRTVVEPDLPLEGTRWVVDALVDGDSVSTVPQGVVATLRFVEGRVEVEPGCNTGGGGITIEGDVITFGPIGTTKMACAAPTSDVEALVLSVLTGKVGYAIEADTLRLGGGNGPGLVLRGTPGS